MTGTAASTADTRERTGTRQPDQLETWCAGPEMIL
jgi:hypothetical protein